METLPLLNISHERIKRGCISWRDISSISSSLQWYEKHSSYSFCLWFYRRWLRRVSITDEFWENILLSWSWYVKSTYSTLYFLEKRSAEQLLTRVMRGGQDFLIRSLRSKNAVSILAHYLIQMVDFTSMYFCHSFIKQLNTYLMIFSLGTSPCTRNWKSAHGRGGRVQSRTSIQWRCFDSHHEKYRLLGSGNEKSRFLSSRHA